LVCLRVLAGCLAFAAFLSTGVPPRRDPGYPVDLSELVPAGDPLHSHALRFDARFAQAAANYLRSPDESLVPGLARLPATEHLLAHARWFDYSVAKDSGESLVWEMLARVAGRREAILAGVAYFMGPLLDDPHWIADALRYLPSDFRFHGSLYLVAGYDIGVALAPHASLNAAHTHFDGHPRELLYYAIHELHHVGFMTSSPPPRVADLKTCADVRRLVDYSTALEGMAVLAARDRRVRERALAGDEDYIALDDEARMERDETQYLQEYDALAKRGPEPADAGAMAVIERMSGGERLWYRVGARMIAALEKNLGHSAMVALVTRSPESLVPAYRRDRQPVTSSRGPTRYRTSSLPAMGLAPADRPGGRGRREQRERRGDPGHPAETGDE
jgi:hypothetical protein